MRCRSSGDLGGLTVTQAQIIDLVLSGVRALISLAEQLGHGDAVREALDAELAASRSITDRALDEKHRPR